ncbi:hypothetical protein T10_3392, partial [Trichinella papuae]
LLRSVQEEAGKTPESVHLSGFESGAFSAGQRTLKPETKKEPEY